MATMPTCRSESVSVIGRDYPARIGLGELSLLPSFAFSPFRGFAITLRAGR